jgi:excisionase family DNA binding protein
MAELIEAMAEAVRTEAASGPATPDRLYSVDEAASHLGIRRSLLYDLIGRGDLRTIVVGRRRLVPAASLSEFIRARDDAA